MKLNEFQKLCLRTCSPEGHQHFFKPPTEAVREPQFYKQLSEFNCNVGLLHALTKISEETGELWKPVNRAMWYGRPLGEKEKENMREEAGDILWYIAGPLCRALGCTLEDIAQGNVAKLKARYPEAYADAAALARADKAEEAKATPKPGAKPENMDVTRLRDLTEGERHSIVAKYGQLVDFADGYYWSEEDHAWMKCPECFES